MIYFLLWSGCDASYALKIQATLCCQVILETESQWMANEIIVSNNKLLQEHLVHPHLYWQHNVNNCITCKTSIKPHPDSNQTNFVTWSSYLTSSTTYLKRHSSCRKCRKWFPSNQCKIAGGIKNNTPPLIFLLNIEIIRILSSSPSSPARSTTTTTLKSFNPLYKVDGGLIELLQFYVQNNL